MKLSSLKITLLLASLLLPLAAYAEKNILVFGDSLSAGYGIAIEKSWAHLLQQELQRTQPEYQVVNASISGETTSGGLRRIADALRQHHPAIVILELGANDGLRGAKIKDIEKNLSSLIRQSQKAGARVVLLGMQLPPNYGLDYTAQYKVMFGQLAQRYHIALVPFFLEGVTPEQFQADNLHPTAEAQPRILQNVIVKLKPLL